MKALVVALCAVFIGVAPAAVANAQATNCSQVVRNVTNVAASVSQTATAYWAHRTQFGDLIFGLSSATVANAMQVAQEHKAHGDALRAGMPGTLANFKDLVAMAASQGCLSPSQLSSIVEPTIKLAKRVNFDQFPEEVPLESTVEVGPPRLPH